MVYVAVGSLIGGVGRFLAQEYIQKRMESVLPYGTFYVNVVGCFMIGVIAGLAERGNWLSPQARIFWATGICGGFTTFSSFINESHMLLQQGAMGEALVYVAASIVFGLLATTLGIWLITHV
jgi:CrcB protein